MQYLDIDLGKHPGLRPSVLKQVDRVQFDVDNPEHAAAYLHFLKEGKWLIKFEPEWPCVTVPATIERKLSIKAAVLTMQAASTRARIPTFVHREAIEGAVAAG